MTFQIKRRLLMVVALGSLLLVGASQAVTPKLQLRTHTGLYLVSQYRAFLGDGDGAVDALLAASEANATCTGVRSQSLSTPHVTEARVECRLGRISKRT